MSSISIRRTRVRFARLATALGVLAILGGGAAWWSSPDAIQAQTAVVSPAAAGPAVTSYADAVAKVSPAVVTVRVEKKASFEPTSGIPDDPFFRRFFGDRLPSPGRQPRQRGLGSGVIIHADGRIVTNAHVVDGADRVRVMLTDGREFDARVVGVDKPTDLAVLDVEATGLPDAAVWRFREASRRRRRAGASATRSASARPSRWGSSAPRAAPPAPATAATRTSCRPMRLSTRATRAARW